jgi:ABC-type dipeptide/oligopeptide/nickel transport system ATPase component
VVTPVDGVSLSIQPGQILGLVGESGSGKSLTGYSIMGLIDAPGRIESGSIRLNGRRNCSAWRPTKCARSAATASR